MVAFCACAGANRLQRTVAAADYKAKDGTAASSAGQAKPQGRIICEDEMPLGSHIPNRVCRYENDINDVRRETQAKLHAAPAVQVKPGG
jgi:hypothetical protein